MFYHVVVSLAEVVEETDFFAGRLPPDVVPNEMVQEADSIAKRITNDHMRWYSAKEVAQRWPEFAFWGPPTKGHLYGEASHDQMDQLLHELVNVGFSLDEIMEVAPKRPAAVPKQRRKAPRRNPVGKRRLLRDLPSHQRKMTLKNTAVATWHERGRSFMGLLWTDTAEIIFWARDDFYQELVEDGFIDPRHHHESLIEYARHMGLAR
jgi:hypothetical protein